MAPLPQGIYQLKYLYAEHVFGWDAEQVNLVYIYDFDSRSDTEVENFFVAHS